MSPRERKARERLSFFVSPVWSTSAAYRRALAALLRVVREEARRDRA